MSKCPIGVNVRVNGCLSLCVPWDDLWPVQVSPAFALCQLGSAPAPRDPNEDEAVLMMDGWMFQWQPLEGGHDAGVSPEDQESDTLCNNNFTLCNNNFSDPWTLWLYLTT